MAGQVMGRVGPPVFLAPLPDQQVPVTDPRIKPPGTVPHSLVNTANQFPGFTAADMTGAVILHENITAGFMAQGHQVAAESHVLGLQANPHAGSLQGRPAGVIFGRIVAHD